MKLALRTLLLLSTFHLSKTKDTCGGNIHSDYGTIRSPNHPEKYGPDQNCTWNITVKEGKPVFLVFSSFDIERSSHCQFDVVEIFDGHDPNSTSLGRFCGETVPGQIQSSTNKMAVKFSSDHGTENKGFSAKFSKEAMCSIPQSYQAYSWWLYNGSCYMRNLIYSFTWYAANIFCESNGAYLASIHSKEEMDFINDMFFKGEMYMHSWIGLRRPRGPNSLFEWSDNTAFDFQYFDKEDGFDNIGDNDTCAALNHTTKYWSKNPCNITLSAICKTKEDSVIVREVPPPSSEGTCQSEWHPFGDKCYRDFGSRKPDKKKSWADANKSCTEMGSMLVSIHSKAEQEFLKLEALRIGNPIWIGLYFSTADETFYWTDGSLVDFRNWDLGQPDQRNGQEMCVRMNVEDFSAGSWKDENCEIPYTYMCQKFKEKPKRQQIVIFGALGALLCISLLVLFIYFRRFYRLKKMHAEVRWLPVNSPQGKSIIDPDIPLQEQTDQLPYDKRWEFPKSRLKFGKTLGQGAFGRVVKAEAAGLNTYEPFTPVAVKMMKDPNDVNQRKCLMTELKILIFIGHHVNILNLLGAVTKHPSGRLMVIVEYCRHGSLRNYLLRHRDDYICQTDLISEENSSSFPADLLTETEAENETHSMHNGSFTGKPKPGGYDSESSCSGSLDDLRRNSVKCHITTGNLISYGFQCARGMLYLASMKVIHRDLATRNVLLADNNVVKICDFGLARDLYNYPGYEKKKKVPLPVKWMAIESISRNEFTTKTDVWSFGVLLWELFSLGDSPYPGIQVDEQFYRKLQDGYRMPKPEFSPANIYKIMRKCWMENPTDRPDFQKLSDDLGELLEKEVKEFYINLNDPYEKKNLSYLSNSVRDSLRKANGPVLADRQNSGTIEGQDQILSVTSISKEIDFKTQANMVSGDDYTLNVYQNKSFENDEESYCTIHL